MATKRLPMRQIREILRLKHDQQLSHRAIASACRVGLGTVADYLGRTKQAGLAKIGELVVERDFLAGAFDR